MDDESFRQILHLFNLSWPGYRKVRKGVKKRIARHMQECGCRRTSDYLLILKADHDAAKKARELLTVSLSRFFRDLRLWETLKNCIIPKLVREIDLTGRLPVRVWSAGCSCGEEAYSLQILWDQMEGQVPRMPPVEIWATDSNSQVLEKARTGIYRRSSLRNLNPSTLQDFFTPVSNGFAIREELKEGIHWVLHDFVSDIPPRIIFDIIFLRNNLLTYYDSPVKVRVFFEILAALRAGGFLIVGNNEEIPAEAVSLRRCSEYRCIFWRNAEPPKSRVTGRDRNKIDLPKPGPAGHHILFPHTSGTPGT